MQIFSGAMAKGVCRLRSRLRASEEQIFSALPLASTFQNAGGPFLSILLDEGKDSRLLKKADQQGRRRSKNRRCALWGTLRILAS
jgi:hypothetical protein